ncbi:MAG: MFS transporter [Verrucomicrobiota bacterium]
MSEGKSGATVKLSIMMFLQFFAWGAWFATLALAMGNNGLSAFIGGAYESAPIAAIFAPLFLGLIADRLFPSEKVLGVLMVLGGILMCLIPGMANSTQALLPIANDALEALKNTDAAKALLTSATPPADLLAAMSANAGALPAATQELLTKATEAQAAYTSSGQKIVWIMIAYMLCYMPTLALGNSIAFSHLSQVEFPKVRVWGTIGWIVAGLALGLVGWSASLNIFWLGAISSLALGIYSFFLPHTPPPAKGKPLDIGSLLMVDAFKLLKKPSFLVFAICSMLICIPLGYYYGQTSAFLGATGFKQAASTMTLGQMSEIFFMILIPFFFRKLGAKNMLLIGMACWVARYVLFAFGAPDQVAWMLLLGVALHGICYDFFFVTGFIYTDKKAPKEIRGQAQSLLVFLTQGLGMFFGFRMAFGGTWPFTKAALPNTVGDYGVAPAGHGPLMESIKTQAGETEVSFVDSLLGMFGKGYPEGVPADLVATAMADWKAYWIFPAGMAAVIAIIFFLGFWDKSADGDDNEAKDSA